MNKNRLFISLATFAALAVSGLLMKPGPAIAQQASDEQASEIIEEIVEVESPIERERDGPAGTTTKVIKLTRQVSFADLDLSKHVDVTEFENRVERVAQESCEKLQEMYPLPRTPSRGADIRRCVKKAIDNSAAGVAAAIASAQ